MKGLPRNDLSHHTKLFDSTSFECIYLNSDICLALPSSLWITLNLIRLSTYPAEMFPFGIHLLPLVVSVGTISTM